MTERENRITQRLRREVTFTDPGAQFTARVMERVLVDEQPPRAIATRPAFRLAWSAAATAAAVVILVTAVAAPRRPVPPPKPAPGMELDMAAGFEPILVTVELDGVSTALAKIDSAGPKSRFPDPLGNEARAVLADARSAARYLLDRLPLPGVEVRLGRRGGVPKG